MPGNPLPFIVSAHFSDGVRAHQMSTLQAGVTEADATARAMSARYLDPSWPHMPLITMSVMALTEDMCRGALALIEANAAAEKAEADKVRPLTVVQPSLLQQQMLQQAALQASAIEPPAGD